MTQKQMIERYLKSGHALTPLIALRKLDCLSLSQRVGELRREGKPIGSSIVRLKSGKRVSRYFWAGRYDKG